MVVTGLGAVTGFGAGASVLASGLFGLASSVRPNQLFPELDGRPSFMAYVDDVPEDVDARADHFLQLAVAEAIGHANLSIPVAHAGIFLASIHGNVDAWWKSRLRGESCHPSFWDLGLKLWPTIASRYSIATITTGCTSSAVAIAQCIDHLRAGLAPVGVVAGVEGMTPFLVEGFKSLRSLAKGNCRPFDKHRDGLVLGEGAAVLVLETLEHAESRGALPLAEITGYGMAADGTHLTAPDPAARGVVRALQAALTDAGLRETPDSINVHGTGTRYNDEMECVALRRVFGSHAQHIPITSVKPVVGHLCGAAGAIEVLCSILSMQRDLVPPILTLAEPDESCGNFDFVVGTPRRAHQQNIISMNSGFGGTNSAIVIRRPG